MRILYLCHRIPFPPDKGDKIRAFHQIRWLSQRHEVDVFTLADRAADLLHKDALASHCHRVEVALLNPAVARLRAIPKLLGSTPLTLPYFHSAELDRRVKAALRERSYDRILVFCSAMAQYVGHVKDIPTVLDMVDVDSDKWRQYAGYQRFPMSAVYRREARRLREYERVIAEAANFVILTTDREARLLADIAPQARVKVIPNGVDTAYFENRDTGTRSAQPGIVFVGDMSYFPNQQAVLFFARQVLPLVRQRIPEVRFSVVGREPSREILALVESDGIKVTGFVTDVRPHLAEAAVSVAPFLVAAGIQNKILEALSFGLAVVATPRAVQGLAPDVAAVIDTGETPEELAKAVVENLSDSELTKRKGELGRRLVREHYSWQTAGFLLEELLQRCDDPVSTQVTEHQ